MPNTIQAAVLKKKEAAAMCGISAGMIDRLRAKGEFIEPIRLGEQAIGFLRTDIEAWIASRPRVSIHKESK